MSLDLSYLGITATKEIYRNLPVAILTEKALAPRRRHAEQHRRAGGENRQVHRPQR